jgi:hypothetical protein
VEPVGLATHRELRIVTARTRQVQQQMVFRLGSCSRGGLDERTVELRNAC